MAPDEGDNQAPVLRDASNLQMIIDIVLYCFNADEANGDSSAAEFAEEYPRVLAEAARPITLLCTKYSCDAHFFAFARSLFRFLYIIYLLYDAI